MHRKAPSSGADDPRVKDDTSPVPEGSVAVSVVRRSGSEVTGRNLAAFWSISEPTEKENLNSDVQVMQCQAICYMLNLTWNSLRLEKRRRESIAPASAVGTCVTTPRGLEADALQRLKELETKASRSLRASRDARSYFLLNIFNLQRLFVD